MLDAAPLNWEEDGVAKGIEIEIIEYLLGNLGIHVKHEFYPWERAQNMIKHGKADAMMTTPIVQRFQYALFGKELVYPVQRSLFIKKGNIKMMEKIPELKKLEDLKPFGIVDYIGNGWTKTAMKESNGYNIQKAARIEQLPIMLALGRGDIAIQSSIWLNWWIKKQGLQNRIVEYPVDWPLTQFHFVFMVSRKSPWVKKGLVRALDEELKRMKRNGIWHEILLKYGSPYGKGKAFHSHLDENYLKKHGFYKDYDHYPIYTSP